MSEPGPVSGEALSDFRTRQDSIKREATARCMRFPDEIAHHGGDAERLITAGFDFTLKALNSAMEFGSVAILEDQLRWAMTRLPHDGVRQEYMLRRLERLREVIEEVMERPYAREVSPYVQWMVKRQRELSEGA